MTETRGPAATPAGTAMDQFRLDGRATGGAQGLGRAITLALAEAGALGRC